jgi:hypothetical protein
MKQYKPLLKENDITTDNLFKKLLQLTAKLITDNIKYYTVQDIDRVIRYDVNGRNLVDKLKKQYHIPSVTLYKILLNTMKGK